MHDVKSLFVTCPECKATRCIKRLKPELVTMKHFLITVSHASGAPNHIDDQMQNPAGMYYFSSESKELALDEFHWSVPITTLDDFSVQIEEVPKGSAISLFKLFLNARRRCGIVFFKIPNAHFSCLRQMSC